MLAQISWLAILDPCTSRFVKLPRLKVSAATAQLYRDLKMLSKNFAIAIAVVLAVVCLAEAREEGPHDMADALRMLQELDRYYTQAARPRISNAMQCCVDQCKSSIQRGIYCSCENCWLQLSNRFGKRSDAFTNWAKDVEKPDLPAWLAYARRR